MKIADTHARRAERLESAVGTLFRVADIVSTTPWDAQTRRQELLKAARIYARRVIELRRN